MRVSDCVACSGFPCTDVQHAGHLVPGIKVVADRVSMVMISEAAPPDAEDDYYAPGDPLFQRTTPLFQRTTVLAFQSAGADVSSIQELIDLGIYFTTAVKCSKTGYQIKAATIKECSLILERELALFPNIQVIMLMGDVAIKALNYIAKRAGEPRVIPAGSTYKIRGSEYTWRGMRVFPSYLQAGPAFFVEKSKREMIAEDIASALRLLQ